MEKKQIRIEWTEETLIAFIRGKRIIYAYPDIEIEIFPPNFREETRVKRAFEDGIEMQKQVSAMEDIVFNIKKKR